VADEAAGESHKEQAPSAARRYFPQTYNILSIEDTVFPLALKRAVCQTRGDDDVFPHD
jgi:hypothetical protein